MSIKEHPFVSVVTPVFNGEKYLRECIESVLSQTYSRYEYLIQNKIGCFKIEPKIPEITSQKFGYKRNCKNSERCAKTMLAIPNYYTLSEDELNKVAMTTKRGINRY